MKKSEIKMMMKEAVKESLNESFVANIIEVVIRTTEKTIERKLDESVRKILRKAILTETKKVSKTRNDVKKTIPQNMIAKQSKPDRLSKDPVINKMLRQTLESTTEGELSEFGIQATDLSVLGETYKKQLAGIGNQGLNENVQIPISSLSEDLGGDTLRGSVLDNSAIASVFKKDYRSTLKKMKEISGRILPEEVQFYKEEK
jgi:hypothetical protein